jgi:hypothetical protein
MNRALVIKVGNPEIADAIADGMKRADRPKTAESVRRLAMRQHSPEEWETMIVQARYDYGQDAPMGRVRRFLLAAWSLAWLGIVEWYQYLSAINREA